MTQRYPYSGSRIRLTIHPHLHTRHDSPPGYAIGSETGHIVSLVCKDKRGTNRRWCCRHEPRFLRKRTSPPAESLQGVGTNLSLCQKRRRFLFLLRTVDRRKRLDKWSGISRSGYFSRNSFSAAMLSVITLSFLTLG